MSPNHRYGRHGPGAWLRWRHRQFGPRSALTVIPRTSIVRMNVPISTERIIFIVTTSPDDFETNEPIPLQHDQPLSLQPSVDRSPLAQDARRAAYKDCKDLQRRAEGGATIVIVDEEVPRWAERLAEQVVDERYTTDNPDVTEYARRIERWKRAYLEQLAEERKHLPPDMKHFPDAKAVNLMRKARVDKKKYIFPTSGRGPFHQRDLAVVSALYELGLCQNLEEYLENIHHYVDLYEDAFRTPGEEVIWPDLSSFRSTHSSP